MSRASAPAPPIPASSATASPAPPDCAYFDAGACRSCTLIRTPIAAQLTAKQQRCEDLLPSVPAAAWLSPAGGADRGFRNRAKLVVGGAPGSVTLGILGPQQRGVDLRDCLIQEPVIREAIPGIAGLLNETKLPPYDVPQRRGELKFVHLTASPDGALMVRFVVRSAAGLEALRGRVDELRRRVPHARVISVNLLPKHQALLEGTEEHVLHGHTLRMRMSPQLSLHLLPQSFFQTNTEIARDLYAQAARWLTGVRPRRVWDLYCGVGGFALHTALALRDAAIRAEVTGVEVSEPAIRSARRSAREAGIDARWVASDATEFALSAHDEAAPDTVIVNPPRRGIGPELCGWLQNTRAVRTVMYSSCNPVSLARDLEQLPGFRVRSARMFDMFPHTDHLEVAVLLERDAETRMAR